MSPASEIVIKSATLDRVHREGDRSRAAVHGALERGGAADAAEEVDALVHPHVADPQQRREDLIVQQRDVERGAGRGAGIRARFSVTVYQWPARNIDTSPFRCGVAGPGVHGDGVAPAPRGTRRVACPEGPSRCGCRAGPASGRSGRRPPGTCRPPTAHPASQALPRSRGAGRAMVPVGDVEQRHGGERATSSCGRRRRHTPDRVPHAVDAVKSKSGAPAGPVGHGVHRRHGRIGQKHGPGLRAKVDDVPRAVVLFVLPRLLVLPDEVARRTRRRSSTRRRPSARARPSAAGRGKGWVRPRRPAGAMRPGARSCAARSRRRRPRRGSCPAASPSSGRETCRKLSGLPSASSRASSVVTTS